MIMQQKIICKCLREFGNNGAYHRHKDHCNFLGNGEKLLKLYLDGMTIGEFKKLGYTKKEVQQATKGFRRSKSEDFKLRHIKFPENFLHSSETKKQMSDSRKEWLRNNKDKHNWRFKEESYPEKVFKEWLETTNLDIIAEYSPEDFEKNYRIDFACVEKKIAIEINGNQHYDNKGQLREYYTRREAYLISKGWKVINIPAINIIQGFENVKKELLDSLNLTFDTYNFKKILSHKEIRDQQALEKKTKRHENKQTFWDNRKKIILELLNEYGDKFGFVSIVAHKFNVTHTQTRRMLKKLNIECYMRDSNCQ